MKRYILLFILLLEIFSNKISFAQNWITSAGGLTHDEALDVCHDQNGNYYVTGYFTNTATFDNTTISGFGFSDIFIAKYNANGQLVWVKNAGGSGPDRGYSIFCDQNGNLFVTGYFTGPATFDAVTLNSVGNTQDVFIAKYDTNGNLQWVNAVGGNLGDTGYGVTSDNLGNVIVTGQYKGTATFGATSLTSVTDPNTNLPSFDIFILKYDSNGNFLWVQNGAAEFDDRGLDVATDDANNIFVVGQYSDTITFDFTYNNSVMNAGFLLKLDENGQEQFFKSMSAVQTLVYSIAIDNTNNVFITGDFRGTMAIVGSPSTYVTAGYYNKIFVAKFDNNGNVLWAEADASDNEITSKSIDLDDNGDAYITGLFKCRFNEYSDLYGDAIFYSAGYRDVFMTKYSSSGIRQWIRHLGGPKDDYCSGIAVKNIDEPFIAGSYEKTFNTVETNNQVNNLAPNINSYLGCSALNCEPFYGVFDGIVSSGQKDIFLTKPFLANREFYDYFTHTSSNCIQDTLIPEIGNGQDTIELCEGEPLLLCVNTKTCNDGTFGPIYEIIWNNQDTSSCMGVINSGTYWMEISREDGCMSHQDTIVVIYHPLPPVPLITDSWNVNILQPPQTTPLFICGIDTVIVNATNVFVADTFYWDNGNFAYLNDSTIQVTNSGIYIINNVSDFGCITSNDISISFFIPTLQYPTDLSIHYTDSIAELTDTLIVCEGEGTVVYVSDSILGTFYPEAEVYMHFGPMGGPYFNIVVDMGTDYGFPFFPLQSGWYEFFVDSLTKICDTIPQLTAYRPLYVIINPKPIVNLVVNGPSNVCPYDTIMLYYSTNADTTIIAGSNIISIFPDSVLVVAAPATPVTFGSQITDTITGCSTSSSYYYNINLRPPPEIIMSPADGIVCPFDSLLLTALSGVAWQWVGPNGNFIGNTQQIYVDVPGYYHCIVTDADGCTQTSNFVEAKEYNTPYLDVFPSNHICSNGNTTLSVIASNSALIQWQAPLSGNSTTQVVNSPGTYVCHITLCGITTIDSITVIQSNTPAYIYSNDSVICPGDTLVLFANGGMQDYEWNPGGSHDNFIYITQPGSYTVMTTDAYGCFGNSSPFIVSAAVQPASPISNDTLICAGQSIILNATATNSILWFDSPTSTTPIFTGNNFSTPIINGNTSYYVQTFDSVCGSSLEEIIINVYQSSTTPSVFGDTVLCFGDPLLIYTDSIPNANYFWTGPNGFTSDSFYVFQNQVDSTNAGIYTLYYSDTSCTSPMVTINVTIAPIPQPYILPDTIIYLCPGNTITLTDTVGYSNYLWSPGNQTTNSITVSLPGYYYVTATENGCSGISNGVTVSNSNPALDPVANSITVCENTSGTLTATASGTISWYDENFNLISTGNSYTTGLMDTTTLYYILNTSSAGCVSNYVPVYVIVPPLDSIPPIFYNQPVCEGGDLYLYTVPLPGANFSWTGPNGFSSAVADPVIYNVTQANDGIYTVIISLNGCSSQPSSVLVDVLANPIAPNVSGNQIYCENDSVLVSAPLNSQYFNEWLSPSGQFYQDTSGTFIFPALLNENGEIVLYVVDSMGCYDSTLFTITVNPTPYASLSASPDVCVGGNVYFEANSGFASTVNWNGPNGFSSFSFIDSIINASSPSSGYYVAEFELNNCFYSDSILIQVIEYPIIDLGPDTALCPGGEVIFSLNPDYTYLWQDGSSNNEFSALDSGLVYVTASVYPGCETNDTVFVNLLQCSSLFPNVFSPNGDGQNDVFALNNNEGAQSIHVLIYNRWGRLVFEINELNQTWEGTDMQWDELPIGVYFWIADVVNYFGETEQYRGYVHLYR